MAEALAGAGAAVMIADVLEDVGRETAQLDRQDRRHRRFVQLDVTDDASWEAAVAATVGELGGLDILVNNAGIEISSLVVDLDPADLRRMLDVNILGTALGIKHGLRAMRPGGAAGNGGAIVNIASVAATIAFPGIAGYSAHQVRRRPADPGRGAGVRQARLRRAGQLRLPRPGARPRWA